MANGPGWSTRTGGDQVMPLSVVREKETVFAHGGGKVCGGGKLAQAM